MIALETIRTEPDSDGDRTLRAEQWLGLVLPDAAPGSPTFTMVAISDPAYTEPLLVATPLALSPQVLRELYRDRWPVEQIPSPPNKCWARPASSCTSRRPASASRSWRSWPGRS